MTEEEIKIAKYRYKNLLAEKNRIENKMKRLEELKNNHDVLEYLSLEKEFKNYEPFDYDITSSFYSVAYRTVASNEILIYMGQISVNVTGRNEYVDDFGDFHIYQDLETEKYYKVRPEDKKAFDESHNVIEVEEKEKNFYGSPYISGFKKIRNEFFLKLMDKTQDEAILELFNERGYTYKKIKK